MPNPKARKLLFVGGPPRLYPIFVDVRNAHEGAIDYASWMSLVWRATDFAGCKIAAGTGDVHPLDEIAFPCLKLSATTITRADTAIADVVAEALAHGCEYIGLNCKEAVPATTILGYWEADQPVVVAAGLKCVCIPTVSVLATLMGNAALAARMIAVTEFIYMQTQAFQTDPDDGTYYTEVASRVATIRTRTATMPILIQLSTEKPLAGSPASAMISQAKSVKGLDLRNGGFSVFCTAANWAKAQTVFETVMTDVKNFGL